jgi:hypothetical protein
MRGYEAGTILNNGVHSYLYLFIARLHEHEHIILLTQKWIRKIIAPTSILELKLKFR